MAIYCARVSSDFASAVRMAVNHDGDSDTTGALVGQLLGARGGEAVLPETWLCDLELREAITTISDDLADFQAANPRVHDDSGEITDSVSRRYPGW